VLLLHCKKSLLERLVVIGSSPYLLYPLCTELINFACVTVSAYILNVYCISYAGKEQNWAVSQIVCLLPTVNPPPGPGTIILSSYL
jgi:hypothetical protein